MWAYKLLLIAAILFAPVVSFADEFYKSLKNPNTIYKYSPDDGISIYSLNDNGDIIMTISPVVASLAKGNTKAIATNAMTIFLLKNDGDKTMIATIGNAINDFDVNKANATINEFIDNPKVEYENVEKVAGSGAMLTSKADMFKDFNGQWVRPGKPDIVADINLKTCNNMPIIFLNAYLFKNGDSIKTIRLPDDVSIDNAQSNSIFRTTMNKGDERFSIIPKDAVE